MDSNKRRWLEVSSMFSAARQTGQLAAVPLRLEVERFRSSGDATFSESACEASTGVGPAGNAAPGHSVTEIFLCISPGDTISVSRAWCIRSSPAGADHAAR
jgi:hypothetical protein